MAISTTRKSLGTIPVFFTIISSIFGAVLFLRFGYAVGMLGFIGAVAVVLIGHLVSIPAALAISEIASNQRVAGREEYFMISRSFGINIGATIGIALYLLQTFSIAFFIIAFTESFSPLFSFLENKGISFHRQYLSIPIMLLFANHALKHGAKLNIKVTLLTVVIIMLSLTLFFIGKTSYISENGLNLFSVQKGNISDSFYPVFAIVFPAFAGITAGMGLSGRLKDPGNSIPSGTIMAGVSGIIIFCFVALKLAISASPDDLVNNQLIISNIAIFSPVILVALAASTYTAATGALMVAPKTLQALAGDNTLLIKRLNHSMAKGRGKKNMPVNATLLTCLIALFFVLQGELNIVAQVITMLFLITYGSICLISFLYYFSADPGYRPVYYTRWYFSLIGFLISVWLMFSINAYYALIATVIMVFIYLKLSSLYPERKGLATIFQGILFQLNRFLHIYIQMNKRESGKTQWRPLAICLSKRSFDTDKAYRLLGWISGDYGYGTYIHLIEGSLTNNTKREAGQIQQKLLEISRRQRNVYTDTLVSSSYTTAIEQAIQLPGISGKPNNMILFEFDKERNSGIQKIIESISLAQEANMDICVLASTNRSINHKFGIHVWIKNGDFKNMERIILLSYIILSHPDWKNGKIKVFEIILTNQAEKSSVKPDRSLHYDKLSILPKNIEVVEIGESINLKNIICEKSKDAGLTIIDFSEKDLRYDRDLFNGYDQLGDILFVNTSELKEIS
jgi:amino acid transporter